MLKMSSQALPSCLATGGIAPRRFVSAIGRRSGYNAYREGHSIAVLRAYFDGSRSDPPHSTHRSITLAGYVAEDATWAEFENGWDAILRSHTPRADYLHMSDLMSFRGAFTKENGWGASSRHDLLKRLLEFLYASHFDNRLHAVCTSIRIDDYERAKSEGFPLRQRSASGLCTALCCEKILTLQYVRAVDLPENQILGVQSIDFFFDQNEPFLHHLNTLWKQHRREYGAEATWGIISQVAPVDMRKHPPVQLADMLAWSRNRDIAIGGHKSLCAAILHATSSNEWNLGYEQIVKPYRRIV